MNKFFIGMLAIAWSMVAVAQSERNNIGGLDVNSKNTIRGNVEATGESTITVGDTQISNLKAGKVTVDIDNDIGAITASEGGTVSLGNVELRDINAEGADIYVKSDNRAGTITAEGGGTVSMGDVSLKNIDSSGKLKVITENEVIGNVTAKGGSTVKIGGTNVQ